MKNKKYLQINQKFSKKESTLRDKNSNRFVKNNDSTTKLNSNRNYWSNIDEIIDYYNNH